MILDNIASHRCIGLGVIWLATSQRESSRFATLAVVAVSSLSAVMVVVVSSPFAAMVVVVAPFATMVVVVVVVVFDGRLYAGDVFTKLATVVHPTDNTSPAVHELNFLRVATRGRHSVIVTTNRFAHDCRRQFAILLAP
jgi:hypothetical protein